MSNVVVWLASDCARVVFFPVIKENLSRLISWIPTANEIIVYNKDEYIVPVFSIRLFIFFLLTFQISSLASFKFLPSINHPLLLYFFQVPLLLFPTTFLHAHLPFLSFILAAVCPFSVLPRLKHLALISGRTGSLSLCSSLRTLFTSNLPIILPFFPFFRGWGYMLWLLKAWQ